MRRADRHDRETFITALLTAVPTATRAHALRLLRWGRTYGRLAEAQCNGDWPADNGSQDAWFCPTCEGGWRTLGPATRRRRVADGTLGRACPSCRAERIILETCEGIGTFAPEPWKGPGFAWFGNAGLMMVVPHFQGDHRGHTVRLQIAGAPLDAYERPALAVPTS